MSVQARRAIGLAAALITLTGVAGYCTWQLKSISRGGWAGFAYVPPVGAKKGPAAAVAGLEPGSVFMVFPGSTADRAGIERGDVIVSINGVPASDLQKMLRVASTMKGGDVVRYRFLRDGRARDVDVVLGTPVSSPTFVATFSTSIAVALAFLLIGIFVFWRLPADPRATVFYVMTLVAAVTFANTALIQVQGRNMRGIVAGDQSLSEIWYLVTLGMTSLFFAPLLLHLALVFPRQRPVIQRRPKIFWWMYGYPAALCVYGTFILGSAAVLIQLHRENTGTRLLSGVLGAVAVVALAILITRIVRQGFGEGILNSPVPAITLLMTLYAAILGAGALFVSTKSIVAFFVTILSLILFGVLTFGSYPVATFIVLFRSYRESGAEERRQVKWPIWATMVAVGGKLILSIAAFALAFSMFRRSALPTALFGVPEVASKVLFVLIPIAFAFAILKYRLMNIDVIIRRTVLYSILTFVVFALYGVLVIGVGTALVRFVGMRRPTMLIASTVIIALAAVPLRNGLQRMVDRNLFREKRDFALALRNISDAIGGSGVDEFLRSSAEQIQEALQNRMVILAPLRDREFVAAAKVGVADEVLGRLRIPADADLSSVPEPLRKAGATLIVPVRTHRGTLGLLAAGSKLSDETFGPDDLEFLHSAASQIAVGIENVRLRVEEVEFEQARAMQQILLPTRFPQLDGFEITGMWQPARSVGGDYYDTLMLGGGKAAICIGDVAGKGMPAALLMANLQAAVKATAAASVEPAVVCERVKEIVGGNLVGGKFISFFYGVLDAASRNFVYSNAGHNPPILARNNGDVERLARGGPAMCRLFRDVPQEQDVATLAAGDRIVLFTDGASEARRGEEEFGDDRLIELILAHRHLGARELQQRIIDHVRDFTAGDFSDDVTLVVIAAQ